MTLENLPQYLIVIPVVLVVAKILGELCERAGIPSILGEISTGILLGPFLLGLILAPATDPVYLLLAEIGIIMLLFVAGFEHVDIKSMLKYKKVSITLSAVSSFVPLTGVVLWGLSMGYPIETSLMLGIALSATSMGITVRSLLDSNQINSKPGRTILGSLVINDITGLILMTLVIGIVASTTGNLALDIVYVLGGIGVFFIVFLLAEYLMPYIILYAVRLRVEEAQFTLVFVVVLFAAFLAQNLGLSTMIGAFFAGIALSRSSILETETFSQKISSISYGLFIPMFFVMAGARIDLGNLAHSFGLAIMMLAIITTLQIGCAFFVGKLFRYSNWKSVLMGIGMLPYGEVTLIVMTALLGLAQGNEAVFGGVLGAEGLQNLFSATLILIAMTILIAPVAMKFVSKKIAEEEKGQKN
jgi:Kef-type K+ transport system membrane component KefB